MNDKQPESSPRRGRRCARPLCWALVLSSMISTPVLSAQTDISSSPITSTNAAQVKPNVMLLVDASGSMGWGHMPDEMESVSRHQLDRLQGGAVQRHLLQPEPDVCGSEERRRHRCSPRRRSRTRPTTATRPSTGLGRHGGSVGGVQGLRRLHAAHQRLQRHAAAGLLLLLHRQRRHRARSRLTPRLRAPTTT